MPRTILVVDDEKNIRLTLTRTLADEHTAVETAVNGEEALDKIRQTAYDLVLKRRSRIQTGAGE